MQAVLMPAQCANCGMEFDLSYDLEEAVGSDVKEIKVAEVIRKLSRKKFSFEHLCWACRNMN